MYSLREFLIKEIGLDAESIPSDSIFCAETNPEITLITNTMKDFLDCFTFTFIKEGHCTIIYNDKKIKLSKNDLYIYTPGLKVEIIEVSDDYRGICLLVEKNIMFENTITHNIVRAAYLPVINLDCPKIHLDTKTSFRVRGEMTEIIYFLKSDRLLKKEACLIIFSLMLIDITEFLKESGNNMRFSQKEESLVLDFMKLIASNFIEQRSIGFYAARLGISPIYLSRIVKQNTGKTVMTHINELVAKEAAWLLRSTDKNVKEISKILNFADQASFNKFFHRMNGVSPSQFRKMINGLSN